MNKLLFYRINKIKHFDYVISNIIKQSKSYIIIYYFTKNNIYLIQKY